VGTGRWAAAQHIPVRRGGTSLVVGFTFQFAPPARPLGAHGTNVVAAAYRSAHPEYGDAGAPHTVPPPETGAR
jgi:hypothetical protein